MCETCHHVPCNPRCPNAPEIYKCSYCDEEIIAGEEFALIDNSYFHKECLGCMDIKDLLDLCGYSVNIAKTDEQTKGEITWITKS